LRRWLRFLGGVSGWLVFAAASVLPATSQSPAAGPTPKADPVSARAQPPRPVAFREFITTETQSRTDMPRGEVSYHGVKFDVTGAIRLGGVRAARERKAYPGAAVGAPVRQRAACVHLLQAAENWRGASRGDPYGKVVLHYVNGETRAFYLRFLVHGMDWWGGPNTPQETVSDPNTRLGWAFRKSDGSYRRLFHTMFTNPLPEVEISTVDFVSPLENANLWLYGLTLSDDTAALAPDATQADVTANRSLVTLVLQDAAGRAVTNTVVRWQAIGDDFQVGFPAFPADARGRVMLDLPPRFVVQAAYDARGAAWLPTAGTIELDANGEFPKEVVVKLNARPADAGTNSPANAPHVP
jgi:hypothetical protein